MAVLIEEDNCLLAWQNASNQIISNTHQDNLLITIRQPCNFNDLKDWIKDRNPQKVLKKADNIRHVINTIMPYGLAAYYKNRNDLYDKYREIYLNSNGNRGWGTYFQRLVSFDKHFSNHGINQLENAITALNGGSPQKHYINFHLTDVSLDKNTRPMGAPCWHFGEITVNQDGSINLVAVYRAQDYFNKALGNYIGLSKLLEFICHYTGRNPGKLIIHAVYAFYPDGVKNNFVRLIA